MAGQVDANRISTQVVGAYGEKVAEAELLRRGWITANINTSIKNAEDFDIFARKGERAVSIRVKASGPGTDAFQFNFGKKDIMPKNITDGDFTVLVSMGATRDKDQFYVIPTLTLRGQIKDYYDAYMRQEKRGGGRHVDLGMWTLHLADLKSGEERRNHGYRKKWAPYLNNWAALEEAAL